MTQQWVALTGAVAASSAFIAAYKGKQDIDLDAVVSQLAEGKFKEAAQALRTLGSKLVQAPEADEGLTAADRYDESEIALSTPRESAEAPPPQSKAATKFRNWVIEHQRGLTTGMITFAVSLAGLQLLYFDNPTYGESAGDALALIGWGFAVQVTGATASQVGRHFSSGAPPLRT